MNPMRLAVTALTAAFVLAPLGAGAAEAPEPAATPAADVVAQQNAFRDVPPNSFAYDAIAKLSKDGLVKGYPDGTFKGNRPLTRYEATVIIERTVEYVKAQLANPQTASTVSEDDIKAIRALLDEFKGDIDSLRYRVGEIEKQQKANTAQLDRQQMHVLYFLRAPGSFREQTSAYAANGNALPADTPLKGFDSKLGGGVNIGQNAALSGLHQSGNGYQALRVFFDGNVDPRTSYHFRLENRYYFDNADLNNGGGPGTSSSTPNYGPSNNYPTNATLRLNYANLTYKDPSGFDVTAGRYFQTNSGLGLTLADYFNGAVVGYAKNALAAHVGYGFNFGSADNCAYNAVLCNTNSQTLFGLVDYKATKQLSFNATYMIDNSQQLALWNPAAPIKGSTATGLYQAVNTPIAVGSLYAKFTPTKLLTLEAEGLHRFGKDPFTGSDWAQPDAGWVQAKYGQTSGKLNGNYAEGGLIQAGFNSLNGHSNVVGTTNYEQFYLANPNGYRIAYGGVNHWFSKDARVGLYLEHFDLIPGTSIPASSTSCPGCFITHDLGNGIFLQTLLSF